MFKFLVRVSTRRPLGLLSIGVLIIVIAGIYGATVRSSLSAGGYEAPGGEAAEASTVVADEFRAGEPNLVILVETPEGPDNAATAEAGQKLTADMSSESGILGAASYWSLGGAPALKAEDDRSALVLVAVEGDEDQVNTTVKAIREKYGDTYNDLSIKYGGQGMAYLELNEQSAKDLLIAESIATPILLLLLIFVFRGVIAALMPLIVGFVSVAATMAILRALTIVTNVSVFSLNLTTALGLGLGIDFSLFILTRYREEYAKGSDRSTAIATTMRTAGKTVVFSALTTALSLLGLLFIPMYFLRSFAYAGVAVVLVACAAALVLLPALLMLLGDRIDKWSFQHRPIISEDDLDKGLWYRVATWVMRKPVPVVTVVTVVLVVLASPVLGLRLSLADARELPVSASAHQVQSAIKSDYSAHEMEPMFVVAPDISGDDSDAITRYATELSKLSNVVRVDALTGSFQNGTQISPPVAASARFEAESSTWLSVVTSVEPYGKEGQKLVEEVRDLSGPWPVLVGGTAASFYDTIHVLEHKIPWALGSIVLAMFVLLFLLTGSVLIPLKALVLNILSLSATFGSMVWVFQQGNLKELLGGFEVTGSIVATIPILMFCAAFGLSMDYEVFIMSRIKEEYDRTGDLHASVANGLQRTGSLISAAALLMSIVMISFIFSQVTFMKLLGLGLALAILLDATIIRSVMVPALMRLMGKFNWWAPRFMKTVHERVGIHEA